MKSDSQSIGVEVGYIARALAGDARAFGALYALQAPRVMGYFLRSGFARAEAEDLTQDTFVRVFKSLGTFDPNRGKFGYWVATIARNVTRRRWSSRKSPENFDPELAEEMIAGPSDAASGVNAASEGEEIDAVRDCISILQEELRSVVYFRYVKGMTTRGISVETSMPEATVRLRLNEASARIRSCLRSKGILE